MTSDGTSQSDRQTPTLHPGFVNVDELSFEELLATAADYSRILNFYNLENAKERDLANARDRDWEPFFTSDEAVILSLILTTNLRQIESEFLRGMHRNISRFGPGYDLNELTNYALARKLDFWLTQLRTNQSTVGDALERKITEVIGTNLRHQLPSLGAFFLKYNRDPEDTTREDSFRRDFSRAFSPIWFAGEREDWTSYPVPDPSGYPDNIERFLRRSFHSFYNAINSLKTLSASLLPESLTSGSHSPAVGLYIAFLRLFQKAQEKVNEFTPNHLNFYYQEVLKIQPRPVTPDSAFLILSTDVADRQVLIRQGTEFTAGVDEDNQYVIYTADSDLLVHGARVDSMHTLHFEHDPLSFPENQLELSSGSKTNQIDVAGDAAETEEGGIKAWPLFGAAKTGAGEELSVEANIGFALASPVLFLKEGHRSISVEFNLGFPDYLPFDVGDLKDPSALVIRLQQHTDLLSQYLRAQFPSESLGLVDDYEPGAPPSPELLQALVDALNGLLQQGNLEGTGLVRMNRALLEAAYPGILTRTPNFDYLLKAPEDYLQEQPDGLLLGSSLEDAFFKTFQQMFTVQITTETGWYQVPEYLPLSRAVEKQCEEGILTIRLQLPPDVPAVVGYSPQLHTGAYDTDLPIVQFLINPAAYLYPYSLLMNLQIRDITIGVAVQGVREVVVANNLGPLDPSSPFNPFGPIPSAGSYLVVGNAEAARKPVTHFDVEVEWGDLPTTGLDFSGYYQAYGMPFSNSIFEARVSALRDGRWQPTDETQQWTVKLFGGAGGEEEESGASAAGWYSIKYNRWSLGDEVTRFFSPAEAMAADSGLPYSALSKNGFFKFTLSRPDYAFGHKEYPIKLTSVLSTNALLKKPELFMPIPNAPYTPLINTISVNYRAVANFNLEQAAASPESATSERIFHLHPFGIETVSPDNYRNLNMVPRYSSAGNLFIGISAPSLSGMLTLFFHLQEDCYPEAANQFLGITWHYLASNQWKQLEPTQVISDTTKGFLTSGVVTLNLPRAINRGNSIMPGDLFWLRVSVVNYPEALCSLYSVHTQTLEVTRQHREGSSAQLTQRLPAGTIQESRVSIPGIAGINQIIDSFGSSPPETPGRRISRVSERLRHKNRAVVPWDYERLILEEFPEIFKVKCFADLVAESGQEDVARPGHVSIVVIPDLKQQQTGHLKPLVNGLILREIQEFVSRHASPFATFKVRNPAYEEIQIRCTVKFRTGVGEGHYLLALDRAITDYISPWSESSGYRAQFGWRMRRHEIESYIRSLDYVDFVTNFSMLRISVDDQEYYRLFDTVPAGAAGDEIQPLYPWSIAIPVRKHFIETTERYHPIPPEPTGINELEIGSTFIITAKENNGEAE
ncbi:MAG: hypothetical protein ACE5Q6_01075 [Dehalococcoidia bacterium]